MNWKLLLLPILFVIATEVMASGTITKTVSVSADDAIWWTGPSNSWSATDPDMYFGNQNSSGYYVNHSVMRFLLEVGNGQDFDSVFISFKATASTSTTVCKGVWKVEEVDNAAAYSSDPSGRSYWSTTVAQTWPAWTSGTVYKSENIASLVNHATDRTGWTVGSYVGLTWTDNGSDLDAYRKAESWDNTGTAPPVLTGYYTVAAYAPKKITNSKYFMDTYINNANQSTNYGRTTPLSLTCVNNALTNGGLIQFVNLTDTGFIGLNKIIDSVYFVYTPKTISAGATFIFEPALKPWVDSLATMLKYDGTKAWGTTGGFSKGTGENTSDGSGADRDTTTAYRITKGAVSNTRDSIKITKLMQDIYAGTRSYGMWIRDTSALTGTRTLQFNTIEAATDSIKPYLWVYMTDIDTTHTWRDSIYDTWLDPSNTTVNHGTDTLLTVQNGPAVSSTKALIHVSGCASMAPAGAIFDNAYYHFYVLSTTNGPDVSWYRSAKPQYTNFMTWALWFDHTLGGGASDSSWGTAGAQNGSAPAENRSNGSGADRWTSAPYITATPYTTRTSAGWDSLEVKAFVQAWHDGTWTPAFGVQMVVQNNDVNTRTIKIYSSDGPINYRPYITYSYHIPPANLVGLRNKNGKIASRITDRRH